MAERFVGSTRGEVLDHVLLVDDQRLASLLCQYARYFNAGRPHQGLGQRIPADPVTVIDPSKPIAVKSVLGGLRVNYRRAASSMTIRSDEIGSPWGETDPDACIVRLLGARGSHAAAAPGFTTEILVILVG